MVKVITYGTFDLIHPGHIRILQRAKQYGDFLIVGLSTDAFNHAKGKSAYHSYTDRKIVVEAIRYVDLVIPEFTWDQKINDIQSNQIDIFIMGDDWKGSFDYLNKYCKVIYLPRTEGISSSKIKNDLNGHL